MKKTVKNVAASVHDRLLAGAHQRREDFTLTLQRYAAERFLYRLGRSGYRDQFVLKGAMLFALWGGSIYRPTRDLDFAGYGSSEAEQVIQCFREIFALAAEDDGVVFDDATLAGVPIRDDTEYHGLRIRFKVRLDAARIDMQIDVGFGNAIEPPASDVEYPTLLDSPAPRIRAYPKEAVVAEKLHAMLLLGERTSRFKDFYDLYVLARQFPFDGQRLTRAIGATFERRRTRIDAAQPPTLAPRFFAEPLRAAQWRTYLDRNRLPGAPAAFEVVGEQLRSFLGPPWSALAEKSDFALSWQPGGRWGTGKAGSLAALTLSTPTRGEDLEPLAAHVGGGGVSEAWKEQGGTSLRRFKPYPEYKDSGVERLGEIPAHWRFLPLKRVTDFTTGWTPPTGERQFYEGDHFWANISDLGPRVLYETQKTISDEGVRESGMKPSPPGALLFAFKLSVGTVSITGASMYTNEAIATFLPGAAIDVTFLYWAAPVYVPQNAIENIYGAQLLNRERIANAWLCAPPADEQRAIATFLDRETGEIDAMVAKKERLIELLQEKRTALITRAVTKGLPAAAAAQAGLDPNVPMKDSGVEWLGEIPVHWEAKQLRWAIMFQRGHDLPGDEREEGDVPLVSSSGVSSTHSRAAAKGPGIVTGRYGTIGKFYLIEDDYWPLNTTLYSIDLRKNDVRFLQYMLTNLSPLFLLNAVKSAVPGVDRNDIHPTRTAVPPLTEQRAISAYLDQEMVKIESLVAKVHDAIERLKELRTTLICAVVTGKIDVREEVAS